MSRSRSWPGSGGGAAPGPPGALLPPLLRAACRSRVIFGITETQGRMGMEADMSHRLKCGLEWDLESAAQTSPGFFWFVFLDFFFLSLDCVLFYFFSPCFPCSFFFSFPVSFFLFSSLVFFFFFLFLCGFFFSLFLAFFPLIFFFFFWRMLNAAGWAQQGCHLSKLYSPRNGADPGTPGAMPRAPGRQTLQ